MWMCVFVLIICIRMCVCVSVYTYTGQKQRVVRWFCYYFISYGLSSCNEQLKANDSKGNYSQTAKSERTPYENRRAAVTQQK